MVPETVNVLATSDHNSDLSCSAKAGPTELQGTGVEDLLIQMQVFKTEEYLIP